MYSTGVCVFAGLIIMLCVLCVLNVKYIMSMIVD